MAQSVSVKHERNRKNVENSDYSQRYDRGVATSLRAAVNKREQQLYQEYLIRPRLKDREFFHTPAGTVGPLKRGLIKATNSGENFEGWVPSRILR